MWFDSKNKESSCSRSNSSLFKKENSAPFFKKNNAPFFNSVTVQPKLKIGQANDPFEREADRMADRVASGPVSMDISGDNGNNSQKPNFLKPNPTAFSSVQTKCAACAHEDEKKLQKKSNADSSAVASPSIESSIAASKGLGSGLPENTQSEMESAFGVDFSNVRIHSDDHAVQMNKGLSSQAFTTGSDIYFNSGKYDTESVSGKRLLAHELTHVVQQGASGPPHTNGNSNGNAFSSTGGSVVQGFDLPFGYETDFSWSGVKTAAGLVGSGVKSAAKWTYNRGKYILGNAWDCAKATGKSAAKLVTGDFDSFGDLIGMPKPKKGDGASLVDWITFAITHPCLKMIPGYEVFEYVTTKFAKAGPFLKGAWHLVNNPDEAIEAIHTSPVLTNMINNASTGMMDRAIQAVTFSSPSASIVDGIWRHLKPKIEYFLGNWWQILKDTAWDMVWPWPGTMKDLGIIWDLLGNCVDNFWNLEFSDAVDNLLEVWRTLNNMFGRLYLWFVIASVLIGAILGGIFGVGAGAIPGALAGFEFAMGAGQVLLYSTIAAETASITKAGFDLVFREQSDKERELDFEQISNSAITLTITGIMALLSALAVRFAKGIISKVGAFFSSTEGSAGAAGGGVGGGKGGGTGGGGQQGWTPRVIQGGKTGGGSPTSTGPVARGGPSYPVEGSGALKVEPAPIIEPAPVVEPAPVIKEVPAAPPAAKKVGVPSKTAPVIGGVTGQQIADKTKKKKKDEDEDKNEKIYTWHTPFNYQGRNGRLNYSGPTKPGVDYGPQGHHVWPKTLGGDPDQTLMTVITTIHQEEIHYGRSPVGSPITATAGSIYEYLTDYLRNSPTYGKKGKNVLQHRKLTHPGGTGSGNELLIPAMKAGTADAARLASTMRLKMTEYYGFFSALSDPAIPYSAYRTGLDESFQYATK